MSEELWQGGIGLLVIGFGVKYLLPMIKSSLDASTSRSGVDAQMHEMYQEILGLYSNVSKANAELTAAVVRLEASLAESKSREEKLGVEVINLRREVAALTEALASARGAKRATD